MVFRLWFFLIVSSTLAAGDWIKTVDPKIPNYQRNGGLSGRVNVVGSDTLNNLMVKWAEGFAYYHPDAALQVEGKGSSTAPPALAKGMAQLAPMSRLMKSEEIQAFERLKGYKPTAVAVALDALAVYVNTENDVEELTLAQIDAIFSKTRKSGSAKQVRTWGQISRNGSLAPYPISLYGRNSASGTYGYFKQNALFRGDFNDRVKEQPGSASVVMAVTEDVAGIGYSGIGYVTSGVKTVRIAHREGSPFVGPSAETVLDGSYPLSRMLFIYVDKRPGEPLPEIVDEYLSFALSAQGQRLVVQSGYIPLPSFVVEAQLKKIQ